MEFTQRVGQKRVVKVDGKLFLMPRNVDVMVTGVYRKLRMQAALRSCQVNGKKCSKPVVVVHHRTDISMETLLALRALRDALMPTSGTAQLQVHAVVAALILRAYDLEHGSSGILDTDAVSIQYKRHVYVMETSYAAGDLRKLDTIQALTNMSDGFLLDVGVLAGKLEPAPATTVAELPTATASPTCTAVAGEKRPRIKSAGGGSGRAVRLHDGVTCVLPWGVYYLDYKVPSGVEYRMLRMQTVLGAWSCQVDGKGISKPIQVTHLRSEVTKETVLALRALRDALLPMYGAERNKVHKVVAALILRAFDLEHPESNILDEAVVAVRISRHGYVKETSYVAGDLRAVNRNNELTIMTEQFLQDATVMSGTLDAASPDFVEKHRLSGAENLSAAMSRGGAAKRKRKAEAHTAVTGRDCIGEKGTRRKVAARGGAATPDALLLPSGVYVRPEGDDRASSLLLKMKLAPVTVNGVECASNKKVRIVGGISTTPRNIDALRSLRDDFERGMGGSKPVRRIIAAKAFRLWLRGREGLDTPNCDIVEVAGVTATPSDGVGEEIMVTTAGELRRAERERARVMTALVYALSGSSKIQGTGLARRPGARAVKGGKGRPAGTDGTSAASSKQQPKRKKTEKGKKTPKTVVGVTVKADTSKGKQSGRKNEKAAYGSACSSASALKQNKKTSRKKRKKDAGEGADDEARKRQDTPPAPATKAGAARESS